MSNNELGALLPGRAPNPENKELSQNSQYNFGIKLDFRKLLFSVKPVLPLGKLTFNARGWNGK